MSPVCFVTEVLSTLRDSVPGARKRHPNLPRCACADRPAAALHFVPGGEPHLLHLPPLLAWAHSGYLHHSPPHHPLRVGLGEPTARTREPVTARRHTAHAS